MTYEVNFIPGDKRSACRNDSYAVVDISDNQGPKVLAFIPLEGRSGLNAGTIRESFEKARLDTTDSKEIVAKALETLGCALQPRPVA